jgi:hypothetical protein
MIKSVPMVKYGFNPLKQHFPATVQKNVKIMYLAENMFAGE